MVKQDTQHRKNRSNAPIGIKERLDYNEDFRLDWRDPDESHDGYQLKWIGKDYARLQTGTAPDTVIIPNEKHNTQPQNAASENIFLTGDNLQVLKHLQSAYRGAIKMIYIDPPYNTGSNDFVYSDKFEFSDAQLKNMLGMTDKEIARLHTLHGRSSHSAWLTFMYPRLRLARNLLSEDGIIFISIDDNEQANLKLLCDEIFGEGNFTACFLICSNPRGRSLDKMVAKTCEYCIAYAKNSQTLDSFSVKKNEKGLAEYDKEDFFGKYKELRLMNGNRLFSKENRPNLWYPIYVNPKTGQCSLEKTDDFTEEALPINSTNVKQCWTWSKQKFCQENHLVVGKQVQNGQWRIYRKDYLNATTAQTKPKSLLNDKAYNNENATEEVRELFQGILPFDFPKPVFLVCSLMEFCAQDNVNDALILDFFAGSGTTAHAVMQLNKNDGGNRKWILCNWAEPTKQGSEARKAGYETIDEITRERIKRTAKQLGDISGFKHYCVQEPAAETIDKIMEFDPAVNKVFADNMAEALGESTLLTTWLAADGYPLTYPVQTVDFEGYNAYYIDNSLLYIIAANWEKEQTQELLNRVGTNKMNLNTIVVFGYSLTLESMKELEINVTQSLDRKVRIEKRW